MKDQSILPRLRALTNVLVREAPSEMEGHLVDWRRRHIGQALAVVLPKSAEATCAVVGLCAETGIKIFPQGGNTSVCGGSVPDAEGRSIVLNMARLNHIRRIDPDDDSLIAEAGCILADVQSAAEKAGRLFPMSLGAEGSCQIGGNIATNAGGTGVLRYGNMRDLVLGLEVVLPDGTLWNGLRTLRKNNSGYDLKNLFVGSEGTLGVITAAALRLFPRPTNFVAAMLSLRSIEDAVAIGRTLRSAFPADLNALEIISRSEMDIVLRHIPTTLLPLAESAPWYVLVEIAGWEEALATEERLGHVLTNYLHRGEVKDVVIAASDRQRADLWRLRHTVSEGNVKEGMGLTHDVAVPIGKVAEFIKRSEKMLELRYPGVRSVVVGHLGDGNLHYIAMFTHEAWQAVNDKSATASDLGHALYDIASDLGGTFSAEHGIGSIHTADMRRYKPAAELSLMRKLKSVVDPAGLMNPGRVLPSSH